MFEGLLKIKTIIKNFSSLIAAQYFYKLCTFIMYVIIARNLGVAQFGRWSFVFSLVALFGVILDMGLSELFVRDIAGSNPDAAKKYLKNIISLKLFLAFIVGLLIIGISLILPRLKELLPVILLVLGAYTIELYTFLFRAIFRTYEKMEIEALTLILEGVLKVGVFLILTRVLELSLLLLAVILIFSNLVILLFSIGLTRAKFLAPGFSLDLQFCRSLLKRTLPFALIFFFGLVNFKIDIIMVAQMMADEFTGWYSAAVKLVEPVLVIPISVAVAFFPAFSRSNKNFRADLLPLFKSAAKILLFLGLSMAIILNLLAKLVLGLTFGADFLSSVLVLRILSWTLLPLFMKFFLERFLLSVGISRVLFVSYFIGTLLNIALNFTLGLPFGLLGIALATLISEILIVGYNLLHLKNVYV
ncbi:flippase [Candidatus Omnitrophota bacterium]